ncbi:MAG: hypothetical protein N2111_12770, partial [Candidatus Sumerlaeaceae bacterium]|nr:hypothetical protein [Candidatus Sumerlaeaceae bacterium]
MSTGVTPALPPSGGLLRDERLAGRFGYLGILTITLTLPYAVPALLDALLARLQLPRDVYLLRPVENQFFHLQFAAVAVGLPYALWRIFAPPGRFPRNSILWIATAFIALQLCSLVAASSALFSLRQFAGPALAWLMFLVVATCGVRGRPATEKLLLVAVAGSIPAALYAVAQSQGYEFLPYSKFVSEDALDEIEGKQMISSTFGHPNYMASYLAPLLFWALFYAFWRGRRLLRSLGTAGALAIVAALVTGGTRGAWLAVLAAAVPLYLLLTLSPAYRRQLLFAAGVGGLAVVCMLFIPNPLVRIQFDLTER